MGHKLFEVEIKFISEVEVIKMQPINSGSHNPVYFSCPCWVLDTKVLFDEDKKRVEGEGIFTVSEREGQLEA